LSGGELAAIERLARRIEQNEPSSNDPERYFVEKGEIVQGFRRLIGALRTGQRLPDIENREQAALTGRPKR
jgi:hypothetical protein